MLRCVKYIEINEDHDVSHETKLIMMMDVFL